MQRLPKVCFLAAFTTYKRLKNKRLPSAEPFYLQELRLNSKLNMSYMVKKTILCFSANI